MSTILEHVELDSRQGMLPDDDPTAANRKQDHIELAFKSQVLSASLDSRFYYEPLLAAHPKEGGWSNFSFVGRSMRIPVWVSSMTGGTEKAKRINHNLAKACREFGMGMGLGSCRPLLYSDERLSDFDIRSLIGEKQPLFANLGIAQLEQLLDQNDLWRITSMIDKLRADGLIIHVNPLQEWLQPEGDRFRYPPIETIKRVIDGLPNLPIIVKEVGQGMGKESLKELFKLPIVAIDFAANGGTNFAKLELLRSTSERYATYESLAQIGHSALEMVGWVNELVIELGDEMKCREVIVSGGIKTFLDGYYLTEKVVLNSVYGQASAFLKHAQGEYDALHEYITSQVRGLELAKAFLTIKE